MKTPVIYFLLLLALCRSTLLPAQDLQGVWTGNYSKHFLMRHPQKLVVELYLHRDSLISGASHLYYSNGQYEHYTLRGIYHSRNATAVFREDSTLSIKLGSMGNNCKGTYAVRFGRGKNKMSLNGKWSSNEDGPAQCPTLEVFLEKPLPAMPDTTPVAVAAEVPVVKAPDRNLQRATEIQSLIEIAVAEKDSIKIEVLDNKEVDGDVLSLYLDDKQLLNKQPLTATPYTLYTTLPKGGKVCQLRIAAESMGSDPPCTALIVITTRLGKRYEINLSCDYNKNGVAELFLKE